MNTILKLIALVFALIMLTFPVLGEMMGTGNEMMRGKAKEMYEKGSQMRENEGVRGMGFMHSQGNSFGNYVTFSVDNKTGDVMNYSILGTPIFDSIKVSGSNFKETATGGAVTWITNNDGSIVIQLHDNPAAVINIMAKAKASIIFDLAEGANAAKEDNIVKISSDNLTAYIASGNATSVNIDGANVSIGIDKGFTIFRASPVNMPMSEMHRGFMGEINRNRAGAEISVGDFDESSIVNYSKDMNVMIKSMEKNRMRMMVNSSDHSGKFIMMNIDNSSLMWNEGQKLRLYLDNKPMRQVMGEQELYNATESSFWLTMMGRNRMEAIMYVANFSERQVDIVVEDEATPTPEVTRTTTATTTPGTPGFEVALGMLCVAAAYGLRRRG
ncbi:MAG TPA: hypothetical protein VKL21_04910 [Candidatus Methanoperedens sp.]|nr:hypothetical protein [Candidatus Methanoperedens sp.]